MSHKVHPYSHRLPIIRDWKSRWFALPKNHKNFLRDDVLIREFLQKKLREFYISSIEIERSQKSTRIIIKTSRPGMIIGRSGEGAVKLKIEIMKLMRKKKMNIPEELKIDITEVPTPEADAAVMAYAIAEGLEKRLPFRRVTKQAVEKIISARGVKGVRILLSGRLGGAEMSRSEDVKKGNVPLQTIRADIDFARERAHLSYGHIGIKVWIYKGEIFADENQRK